MNGDDDIAGPEKSQGEMSVAPVGAREIQPDKIDHVKSCRI